MRSVTVQVYQNDWIPGFACFSDNGSLQSGSPAHVAINLMAFLECVEAGDLQKEDLPYAIAESIMHEVIHALESWAGTEFSEDRIEELLTKYRTSNRTGGHLHE